MITAFLVDEEKTMKKKILIVCGQEIICERNDGGKNAALEIMSCFVKCLAMKMCTYVCLQPEVPSFYTKDYVGAGISISS